MKILIKNRQELRAAGRWDIDFHLPPLGIKIFDTDILMRVDQVADVIRETRDPSLKPEELFQYVDIASVDNSLGAITNPQEVIGIEAPSRARKVIQAFDLVVSTVRPTRGAIAVVPEYLHNEIASTGFTIVRPTEKINPFYLQFALRMPSTLEQFRKWSTGSSYPAILDEDVAKTLIPVPDIKVQDQIAIKLLNLYSVRMALLEKVNGDADTAINEITQQLSKSDYEPLSESDLSQAAIPQKEPSWDGKPTVESIFKCISELPPISIDQKKKRSKQPVSNDRL
jgi:hypothetical protein